MAQLFSFNSFSGLTPGIRPSPESYNMQRQRMESAKIVCGDLCLRLDQRYPPELKAGVAYEGDVHTITPRHPGARSFKVLGKPEVNSTRLYVLIDPIAKPKGVKEVKVTGDMVNAFVMVKKTDGVEVIMHDRLTGAALIEFQLDGSSAFVWSPDGMIYQICREGITLVHRSLTPAEIAGHRVEQLTSQIDTLDLKDESAMRRYHGIIAGAIRLLRHTRDVDARDVLVDFLVEQIGPNLTDSLRNDIRCLLLYYDHPKANFFLRGAGIVILEETKSSSARRKLTPKKKERSLRDQETRLRMRGGSGGGKQQRAAKN